MKISTCVHVDGLLYGVTGPTGVLTSQGFTIDLIEDERYSVDIIATWSPDDKVFLLHRLGLPLNRLLTFSCRNTVSLHLLSSKRTVAF